MDENLPYVYIGILENGTEFCVIKKEKLEDWYTPVSEGNADVLRVLSFSEQARSMSGKTGITSPIIFTN